MLENIQVTLHGTPDKSQPSRLFLLADTQKYTRSLPNSPQSCSFCHRGPILMLLFLLLRNRSAWRVRCVAKGKQSINPKISNLCEKPSNCEAALGYLYCSALVLLAMQQTRRQQIPLAIHRPRHGRSSRTTRGDGIPTRALDHATELPPSAGVAFYAC